MSNCIVIMDFGSQYTLLLAKAVRNCNVFSEIVPCDIKASELKKISPKGIILSGSPYSVYEENAPHINSEIVDLKIPILGVCYGMQELVHYFGGKVIPNKDNIREYGGTEIHIEKEHILFKGISHDTSMWMSHGDSVEEESIPKIFDIIARSNQYICAIANDTKKLYACQFHPEVTHSKDGLKFIENFVLDICKCDKDWNMSGYIEKSMEYVRNTVGNNDILCFVSGGVDSSFVAALLSKTKGIGKVYPVYINALMRKNESEEIVHMLKQSGIEVIVYDAEKEFIDALANIDEPESKRKKIGDLFGKIMGKAIDDLGLKVEKTFLAQGTLYTDLIESGKGVGKNAEVIKSHHNVGCKFIEYIKESGRIVEPNRMIFKDEVRKAACEIGLPEEICFREPFPGPGLGIRIVNSNPMWIDNDFQKINERLSVKYKKSGYNVYVLPVKTVGVQGDKRSYSFLGLISGKRDTKTIFKLSKEITSSFPEINRVVYEVSDGEIFPESTIETFVTSETIEQLKEIDYLGRKIIKKNGYSRNISQTIFTLFGSDLYDTGKRSAALRAVVTSDFMTVRPLRFGEDEMSWECIDEIKEELINNCGIGAFVIDISEKPPATTCWE